MLFVTLYFLYALSLLFLTGLLAHRVMGLVLRPVPLPNLADTLLIGIVSITSICSWLSLFCPINKYVHAVFLALLLIYGYWDRSYALIQIKHVVSEFRRTPYVSLVFCFPILALIIYASGEVQHYDTGLYHAQAVRWINEYGVVPGLGNLIGQLGFDSSWFVFGAFFNVLFFNGRSYHLINLIMIFIASIVLFRGLREILDGNVNTGNILRCLYILPIFAYKWIVPSLSPDLPIALLLFYVVILVVDQIEIKNIPHIAAEHYCDYYFLLVVIVCFFLLTLKLSAALVCLFPAFLLLISRNRKPRNYWALSLGGIYLILPLLIRSVVLSGYLIYPLYQLDLLTVDWKIPYATAKTEVDVIRKLAIYPKKDEIREKVLDMGPSEWFYLWYRVNIRKGRYLPQMLSLMVSPLLLVALFVVNSYSKSRIPKIGLLLQSILLLGVLFWFFSAPDPRFGGGWIFGFASLPLAALASPCLKSLRAKSLKVIGWTSLVLASALIAQGLGLTTVTNVVPSSLITVKDLPTAETGGIRLNNGIILRYPIKSNQLWNAELPGTSYLQFDTQARGETIKQGFKSVR